MALLPSEERRGMLEWLSFPPSSFSALSSYFSKAASGITAAKSSNWGKEEAGSAYGSTWCPMQASTKAETDSCILVCRMPLRSQCSGHLI